MSNKSIDKWRNLIEGANKAEEHIDTYSDKYLICPYCGDKNDNYNDLANVFFVEGEHYDGLNCEACGKNYIVHTEIRYWYETEKSEELEE